MLKHWAKDLSSAFSVTNCTGFAVCLSRLWVLRRPKLRLRSAQPSTPDGCRSRFHWRNGQKQPTQNIAAKKRARQEDADSDYLFDNLVLLPAFGNRTDFRRAGRHGADQTLKTIKILSPPPQPQIAHP